MTYLPPHHLQPQTPPPHVLILFFEIICATLKLVQGLLSYNRCYSETAVRASGYMCVCVNWKAILDVTHRCRSCCLSAGRTSGGSHTPAQCLCHHMCAGNRRFHSYTSLKTTHTYTFLLWACILCATQMSTEFLI